MDSIAILIAPGPGTLWFPSAGTTSFLVSQIAAGVQGYLARIAASSTFCSSGCTVRILFQHHPGGAWFTVGGGYTLKALRVRGGPLAFVGHSIGTVANLKWQYNTEHGAYTHDDFAAGMKLAFPTDPGQARGGEEGGSFPIPRMAIILNVGPVPEVEVLARAHDCHVVCVDMEHHSVSIPLTGVCQDYSKEMLVMEVVKMAGGCLKAAMCALGSQHGALYEIPVRVASSTEALSILIAMGNTAAIPREFMQCCPLVGTTDMTVAVGSHVLRCVRGPPPSVLLSDVGTRFGVTALLDANGVDVPSATIVCSHAKAAAEPVPSGLGAVYQFSTDPDGTSVFTEYRDPKPTLNSFLSAIPQDALAKCELLPAAPNDPYTNDLRATEFLKLARKSLLTLATGSEVCVELCGPDQNVAAKKKSPFASTMVPACVGDSVMFTLPTITPAGTSLSFPSSTLHSKGAGGPVSTAALVAATSSFPLLHSENVLWGKPGGESGVDTVTTTRTGRVVKRVLQDADEDAGDDAEEPPFPLSGPVSYVSGPLRKIVEAAQVLASRPLDTLALSALAPSHVAAFREDTQKLRSFLEQYIAADAPVDVMPSLGAKKAQGEHGRAPLAHGIPRKPAQLLNSEEGVARSLWAAFVSAVEGRAGCPTFGSRAPVLALGTPPPQPLKLECARFVRFECVLGSVPVSASGTKPAMSQGAPTLLGVHSGVGTGPSAAKRPRPDV